MYICNNWYVLYVLADCSIPTRPDDSQLKRTTSKICCVYTSLPTDDDGHLASPRYIVTEYTEDK
jgi:hypothetical protein